MLFKLTADAEFDAENIDEALLFLSNYFNQEIEEEDRPQLLVGEIQIKPMFNSFGGQMIKSLLD